MEVFIPIMYDNRLSAELLVIQLLKFMLERSRNDPVSRNKRQQAPKIRDIKNRVS